MAGTPWGLGDRASSPYVSTIAALWEPPGQYLIMVRTVQGFEGRLIVSCLGCPGLRSEKQSSGYVVLSVCRVLYNCHHHLENLLVILMVHPFEPRPPAVPFYVDHPVCQSTTALPTLQRPLLKLLICQGPRLLPTAPPCCPCQAPVTQIHRKLSFHQVELALYSAPLLSLSFSRTRRASERQLSSDISRDSLP